MYLRMEGDLERKDNCIKNFISRGFHCLQSIRLLCESRCFSDAWVIYRVLIERLFYLRYLNDHNEYREFEEWSFLQSIKYRNHIMSDEEFCKRVKESELKLTESEAERIRQIDDTVKNWKRPKMEDIAKSMKMKFLYDYGYNHASTSVHPLINDGIEDYLDLTKLKQYANDTIETLKKNSILIGSMLLQEGLNNSKYKWMTIVYDCIDAIRNELELHKNENILVLKRYNDKFLEDNYFVICSV
jgi:hypothetical protein